MALLQGDRALEPTIAGACPFGDERAALLQVQLDALTSRWPKGEDGIGISNLGHHRIALDPAAVHELWPLFVASCLDPTAPDGGHDTLDGLTHGRNPRVIELVRALAATHTRTGGITIDFSHAPAFDTAVQQARTLTRAGNDDAALDRILTALPHWQPRSPAHLAPIGLLTDRDTAHLFIPEHRLQLLTTPRATTT